MSIINKLNVFHTPPPLVVQPGTTLSGYLINTNGLKPTTIRTKCGLPSGYKRDKIRDLAEVISVGNYSIVSITETHDTNLTLWVGKEKTWDTEYSTPTTGIHGTATMASLGIFARVAETNVSAIETTWEGQDLMVITAYFPNEEKGTKATIRAVDRVLKVNQTKRIILTGDFNSTETLGLFDTAGDLPPGNHRDTRSAMVQELLDKWHLKDMWKDNKNPVRDQEKDNVKHMTHWNWEMTRGVRIDRVYTNFEIEGGHVMVTTETHLGSDHKGISWHLKGDAPKKASKGGQKGRKPPDKAPHRAYLMEETKVGTATALDTYLASDKRGKELLDIWDKTKREVVVTAYDKWTCAAKSQGKDICDMHKARDRAEKNAISTPQASPHKQKAVDTLNDRNFALAVILEKDREERHTNSKAKWTEASGGANKTFLAKPRSATAVIANMTVDNIKDCPDLDRTDDIDIISKKFVTYYGELYKHKKVRKATLAKLIENLTLKLTPEDEALLEGEILEEEMLEAILRSPNGKSPGSDTLPYEAYKAAPEKAARALVGIANMVTTEGIQPNSWRDLIVSVLPKEADSYTTHKFRPISLLNTDYKLVMRVWANRLGPILARLMGHHQRGFIPGRDGRENIINVQLIMDLINARMDDEGAVLFLDQEKAFDMVSFTSINTIFAQLNWPVRFQALLATVYAKNKIKARVRVNGKVSGEHFNVNSGTRQGCPLSLLIYAVVADLFNMAVISDPDFKGHETTEGNFLKSRPMQMTLRYISAKPGISPSPNATWDGIAGPQEGKPTSPNLKLCC